MKTIIRSPMRYIQGKNILADLAAEVATLGNRGAFALSGPTALSKYEHVLRDSFAASGRPLELRRFGGECSQREIDAVCQAVTAAGCDLIIGLGGGKTLDTAKAVGLQLSIPVAVVPTAASSDAPCSALSVLYTDEGRFDRYLMLKNNPDAVILDSAVVADAPVRLLVAGMGDALATYYEARSCHQSRATAIAGGVCSETALALATTCRTLLFEHGLRAKLAVEHGMVNTALEAVIEANTYLSGVGFESGGLAAAHSIHNGLTVIEATHAMLHGEKVAFGTLVHLVLENAPNDEVVSVVEFCQEVGLPTTLEGLGIAGATRETIMPMAEAACAAGETIHNMPFPVTPEDVCAAVFVADSMGRMLA
ncbi:MAG: glycerol dehydrogenase [Planctomycetes bacterium]|nr:glycerol dehydrogenase [Planctomycetota bacterium]